MTEESLFKDNELVLSLSAAGALTTSDWHVDRYFGSDHGLGGTIGAEYFFAKYFGVGADFSGFSVDDRRVGSEKFVGNFLVDLRLRYPIGSFAPYVALRGGPLFNGGNKSLKEPSGTIGKKIRFEILEHDVKLDAEAAVGTEFRLTKNWGIFAEAAFDKVDRPQSNFVSFRSGLNFAF